MSVKVNNVTKYYGSQAALKNVSFNVGAGEIVGLLGPNGAGKSTMMKIITCFMPPGSGEVNVCGFDILEQSLEVRKKVGYLPENNPLYLDMYVREYLLFIAGIHNIDKKESRKRVEDIIKLTGLFPEDKKKIGALSKGYKQRVGLAQALIHDPEVLILDEPTAGLDPNQLVDIRNLIKKIGGEKTIILSTHIMQEVEAVCDRAIIIDNGVIVADDTTANLSNYNAGDISIIVEFDKPVDPGIFKNLSGIKSVVKDKNGRFILMCNKTDIRADIFNMAVKNNLTVISLQKEEHSIEEVFHQLTKNKKNTK